MFLEGNIAGAADHHGLFLRAGGRGDGGSESQGAEHGGGQKCNTFGHGIFSRGLRWPAGYPPVGNNDAGRLTGLISSSLGRATGGFSAGFGE
jgi:hypothetical protein